MDKKTLAVKVSHRIAEKVRTYCVNHGIKQGFFVEKALEEKLEQEELKEDLLDFKTLHHQEDKAIGFEEYLRQRA